MTGNNKVAHEIITEALWLWTTLVIGISGGAGATALLYYALGVEDSSALRAGFAVVLIVAIIGEIVYRVKLVQRTQDGKFPNPFFQHWRDGKKGNVTAVGDGSAHGQTNTGVADELEVSGNRLDTEAQRRAEGDPREAFAAHAQRQVQEQPQAEAAQQAIEAELEVRHAQEQEASEGHKVFREFLSIVTEQRRLDPSLPIEVIIAGAIHSYPQQAETLRQLYEAQQQLLHQERLSALGQMASGIVHDFNNALTPILGFTSLLIEKPEILDDRETTLRYLNSCHSAGQEAAHIINRLRDFYRPRDQAEPFISLDINDVVHHAYTLSQYVWRDKAVSEGKTIDLGLDLGVLPPVTGNPTELTEVLTNLIINAVDAIPASGSINIRTRLAGNQISLEIADTGMGMPEEVRQRCFEPFFTTKGDKGTGLGLAVAYGVVQRHGGRIEVESQIGRGTTFRIWLPAVVYAAHATT